MTDKEFLKLQRDIEETKAKLQEYLDAYEKEVGKKYISPIYLARSIWARKGK